MNSGPNREMLREADPFDLDRFVRAQQYDYARALGELRNGRKRSHWMWYIFPQFRGLGFSSMSQRYAIGSVDEAKAFLRHPVLGPRLTECANALLAIADRSATDILGSPDDLKLRSSATLFAHVAPPGSEFERLLQMYWQGEPDQATLELLREAA
jgi:uncharacterized protein (DUF1810 family)